MNRLPVLIRVKAKLGELLPPEHPDTEWIYRLAVLRDDLAFEAEGMARSAATTDAVWCAGYALRRLAVTLQEIKNVLTHDVRRVLAEGREEHPPDFAIAIGEAVKAAEEATVLVLPIRNELGGHVRPRRTRDIVRAHADTPIEILFDVDGGGIATSFRGVTAGAFLYAWPDVVTDEDFHRKRQEFSTNLRERVPKIVAAIDMLLLLHCAALDLPRELETLPGELP